MTILLHFTKSTYSYDSVEWSSEQSSYFADQIAAAKREWIKDHNDELEKRLANAIEEVRRIWDEEQKLKTKEV